MAEAVGHMFKSHLQPETFLVGIIGIHLLQLSFLPVVISHAKYSKSNRATKEIEMHVAKFLKYFLPDGDDSVICLYAK